MNGFDTTLFHLINNLSGHWPLLDGLMKILANDSPILYGALFVLTWFILPRTDHRTRHGLIISVLSGLLALALNVVIAHFWFRPRPFAVLPKGTFHQLITHPNDASFPSDHAAGSFAFAFGVWPRGPRIVRWTFLILAILVAFARVYVGVHWPTDVIGGAVIGLLSSIVVWRLQRYLQWITRIGMRICRLN